MGELTLESIRQAAAVLAGKIHRTPLIESRTLSEMSGFRLFLKAENLQKTGCFKPRGALNKIANMDATPAVCWPHRPAIMPRVSRMPRSISASP